MNVTPQVPALPGMTPLGIAPKPAPKKPANPYRITARQVAEEAGFDGLSDALEEWTDSIVPACCTEGCEVEPDGRCSHGCPSVLIALGMI